MAICGYSELTRQIPEGGFKRAPVRRDASATSVTVLALTDDSVVGSSALATCVAKVGDHDGQGAGRPTLGGKSRQRVLSINGSLRIRIESWPDES